MRKAKSQIGLIETSVQVPKRSEGVSRTGLKEVVCYELWVKGEG